MALRQHRQNTSKLTQKALMLQIPIIAILLILVGVAVANVPSDSTVTRGLQNKNEFSPNFSVTRRNETAGANLLQPKLSPIPESKDINPQKADEVEPSPELMEIIAKIKNGTLPEYTNNTSPTLDYSVTEEDLAIIKSGGTAVTADEVEPSPALKAVLDAYRNGKLDYTLRDIKEVEEELFYHQPYSEMNMASIYDLVVLQTGRDIFLSLDYSPLSQNGKSVEAARSRRIKDLAMTISAIKFKEKQNEGEETAEYGEKHKTPMVKIKIKPKETFTRRMLNFLGIRPRDVTVDYEKLTTTYRAFQRWSAHIEEIEEMQLRKRRRKIQLIHQRRYRPSKRIDCSDPLFRGVCPDGQLKIDPYKKGNIRFLKP